MNSHADEARSPAIHWMRLSFRWTGMFFYYALTMVAIGAATGCIVFLLLGRLFIDDGSWKDLALYGLKVGTILSGIWAPGVAIVKCFVQGKKERDS